MQGLLQNKNRNMVNIELQIGKRGWCNWWLFDASNAKQLMQLFLQKSLN